MPQTLVLWEPMRTLSPMRLSPGQQSTSLSYGMAQACWRCTMQCKWLLPFGSRPKTQELSWGLSKEKSSVATLYATRKWWTLLRFPKFGGSLENGFSDKKTFSKDPFFQNRYCASVQSERGGWSGTDLCWLLEPSTFGSFVVFWLNHFNRFSAQLWSVWINLD